ncbi:MAG TPA: pyridoxal phosphate-dependent aminotransferase [Acholeplasma sp.]|jgi:cystathionine beta-lyase|nr:pyridoxal phosphate-dependent aminotransferase [Acholeplasma sp.]
MSHFDKVVDRRGTNCFKWDTVEDGVYSFTIADSDYEVPKEVKAALLKRVEHGIFGYTIVPDSYYEAVINWCKRRYGFSIKQDDIIIMNKVLESIALLINLYTKEGDKIVINPPVYPPFFSLTEGNNRELALNHLINDNEYYSLDFEDLENKFKEGAKMYILCNPHNPVGKIYSKAEIEKIVKLCNKYDVFLVSDEIHSDLIIYGHKFTSVGKYFDLHDKMAICISPSKTFNIAGLKIANLVIKNEEIKANVRKHLDCYKIGGASLLSLLACEVAYNECEYWVVEQQKHLYKNYELARNYLNKEVPHLKFASPESTYLLWINLQYLNKTSAQIIEDLKKYKLAVNSGCDYCDNYDGYIRFNLACPESVLKEGLKRLVKYLKDQEKNKTNRL